jgi:hypothetical protein
MLKNRISKKLCLGRKAYYKYPKPSILAIVTINKNGEIISF